MKNRCLIVLAFPLLLISGSASALSSYCSSYYGFGIDYLRQYYPECLSGTSGNVSQDIIRGTSIWQGYAISDAVKNRFNGARDPVQVSASGMTGLAAGASQSKWSTWGSFNLNGRRYSAYGFNISQSESDTTNLVLGADYLVTPKLVAGVSLAFDATAGRTYASPATTAAGGGGSMGIDTSGYNIAPYLGWQITPEWSLDASFGFGEGRYRDDVARAKSTRSFVGTNLSYTRWHGNWQFLGKASYFHATEKYGNTVVNPIGVIPGSAYRNRLDQFRIGAQAGYWMNGAMPYIGLAYTNDFRRTAQPNSPWDRDAFVMTLGIDFTSTKDNVTGGFAFTQELGRNESRNYSFIGTLNIRF